MSRYTTLLLHFTFNLVRHFIAGEFSIFTNCQHLGIHNESARRSVDTYEVKGFYICISLDTLLELQGITKHDPNSRKTMKRWVQGNFENSIVFLSSGGITGQLIMSTPYLHDISQGEKVFYNTVPLSDQTSLRHAGLVLRKMIIEHTENCEPLSWPPTVESVEKR